MPLHVKSNDVPVQPKGLMGIRVKIDLVTAFVISSFGLFVIYEASSLPYVSEFGPGPGFLPLWLGILTLVLTLLLVLNSFFSSPREKDVESRSWVGAGRALSAWLGLMGSIALLPKLGFSLSLALLTFFLIFVLDRRSPWIALNVAVALALGFHLIFSFALGVSLPSGPWGF